MKQYLFPLIMLPCTYLAVTSFDAGICTQVAVPKNIPSWMRAFKCVWVRNCQSNNVKINNLKEITKWYAVFCLLQACQVSKIKFALINTESIKTVSMSTVIVDTVMHPWFLCDYLTNGKAVLLYRFCVVLDTACLHWLQGKVWRKSTHIPVPWAHSQ